MSQEINVLMISAASIGFFHTLFGPDHYLPFIMIGKARSWNLPRVLGLTFLCGIGHILSSVLVGIIGITLELQVEKLNWFESFRGNLAAWALITFGLLYALWGIRRIYKHQNHSHQVDSKKTTPWVLFIIFALGPCEPLIPILMYPAAAQSITTLVSVTAIFGLVTLFTMMTAVLTVSYGFSFINLKKFENLGHLIAGLVIFLSGLAIQVLGL